MLIKLVCRRLVKMLVGTALVALLLVLSGCSDQQGGPTLTYKPPQQNEVLSGLDAMFSLVRLGFPADSSEDALHETQEQTPYAVYKGQYGGPVLTHYMLSDHNEVVSAIESISSFVSIDLTQSWERLDWEELRPLVRLPFDLYRRELADNFRTNQLETRVESVEISHIAYIAEPIMPGHPVTYARASGKVTIRYLNAQQSWLDRHGVVIDSDYTFDFEASIHKVATGLRDQSLSDIISDVWKVGHVMYEVNPSQRLPIR